MKKEKIPRVFDINHWTKIGEFFMLYMSHNAVSNLSSFSWVQRSNKIAVQCDRPWRNLAEYPFFIEFTSPGTGKVELVLL